MFEAFLNSNLIHTALHLDIFLVSLTQSYGAWIYLVLFLIIFCETGVVLFPFLPGDSLLFAAGSLCSLEGSNLNPYVMALLLLTAAFLGDNLNYSIGKFIGPKVFEQEKHRFFKKKYLDQAKAFFSKYGKRSVVFARFMPILRTFAPFVAGAAQMSRPIFMFCSFFGSVGWIGSFFFAGYFFGNISSVKTNFHYVIVGVILISFLPIVIELLRAKLKY